MWWDADADVNFLIEYKVDGEYVIPSSATATVRDDAGDVITGLVDVALNVTTTSDTLTIPGADNAVDAEALFETRYISVSFVYSGKTYRQMSHYRIAPFLPLAVTPDDVRRELGLGISEVPDEDVDVRAAYFLLKRDYGDDITTSLIGGSEKTLAVNTAIAVKAALELVNGLQFKAFIKMKAEDSSVERMTEFDVGAIRRGLGLRLSDLLDIVLDTTTGGSVSILLSFPTDAITGE